MKWISVEERLPEPEQYVIGYCHGYPLNYVSMIRHNPNLRGSKFWNDSIDRQANGVSHWMPLPEPPK